MTPIEIILALLGALPQTVEAIQAFAVLVQQLRNAETITDADVETIKERMLIARDEWNERVRKEQS